ncbi:zinc finger protein 430-like [Rhincodon typus]|uniref:zinc finger protein 430-like n=1 Tax=Rhincodon typus TaxID=259920 RepID=UPI00202FAD53|nr:zinc finger protein 430-like [Rhincodon typus]
MSTVVDGTISDHGWNQITGSQLTEKQADNTEQLFRKVIIDDQHYNSQPVRDDNQRVQTTNSQFSNTCRLCGAIFSQKSGLVDHIQFVHQRYKPHVCTLCDQKFRRPSELKTHVERRHDTASHERTTCVNETARDMPVSVTSHDHLPKIQIYNVAPLVKSYINENGEQKLSDEMKFVQDAINQVNTARIMTVRNKKAIKRPKRVHKCSLCGNKYLYYSTLWKHRLMHGGKKKHFCLLCGSGFFRSKNLDIHFKSIHLQAFKFKCPHCEKGFNRPIDAQKHIIIRHTDLKNFICRICNRNTETASALQNHIKKYHSPTRTDPPKMVSEGNCFGSLQH